MWISALSFFPNIKQDTAHVTDFSRIEPTRKQKYKDAWFYLTINIQWNDLAISDISKQWQPTWIVKTDFLETFWTLMASGMWSFSQSNKPEWWCFLLEPLFFGIKVETYGHLGHHIGHHIGLHLSVHLSQCAPWCSGADTTRGHLVVLYIIESSQSLR